MGRVLGVRELRKALPRPGFGLLLDRVEIESREKLTGLKVVTVNEEFFNGHFPIRPIMPGVLQVEMMKQLAELSARPELAKSADEDIHIAKMEKVKDCLKCGRCKAKCPYGLDTPELLRRNYEDYLTFI